MRYRLSDIDIIIRKTLQYVLLTGLLALVYFGSVVRCKPSLVHSPGAVAGRDRPLRPPHRRPLHPPAHVIDRRFFRQKYDAQQVLAAFALAARDETDLDCLTVELARVVGETRQPVGVGVWLRTGQRQMIIP